MNKKELKEELLKLGLSEEVLSGIEKDKWEGLLDTLKPKSVSFDDFLKDPNNQGELDRRITKALDTQKKKLEKGSNPTPPNPNEVKGDKPEWLDGLIKKIDDQAQEIKDLKKGTIEKSKFDQAKILLNKSKLPDNLKESWLNRIDINSETPLEDQVSGLSKEYESLTQSFADSKELGGNPPTGSKVKPGMSKDELKKALN
ncbi:hypothetical protein [Aquimarina sp. 2201CG5-10]|uniref:hypothetical protein n=1 Tax=Aquimarina callyspongiae TaxID=3098150 RepID=UPI002AB59398|nr:hypothetical protein [Aquimarina sp. 2201CG5-10]MDY8137568.1 hypothetical protein [Aquimarina sp. 2201CG5-10]